MVSHGSTVKKTLGCYYHCDEYPFSSMEDMYGVYKEIRGPAIFNTYGEDVMIVEPIDYVLRKDAFKTMHAYVRDFRTTRALEGWELCDCSLINALSSEEIYYYTVDLEKFFNVITEEVLKINNSKMYHVWGQQSEKIIQKEYLHKNKIRGRMFPNPERMMKINFCDYPSFSGILRINGLYPYKAFDTSETPRRSPVLSSDMAILNSLIDLCDYPSFPGILRINGLYPYKAFDTSETPRRSPVLSSDMAILNFLIGLNFQFDVDIFRGLDILLLASQYNCGILTPSNWPQGISLSRYDQRQLTYYRALEQISILIKIYTFKSYSWDGENFDQYICLNHSLNPTSYRSPLLDFHFPIVDALSSKNRLSQIGLPKMSN
ncbi:hypothetical protein YC2023_023033 [Brassica napus]